MFALIISGPVVYSSSFNDVVKWMVKTTSLARPYGTTARVPQWVEILENVACLDHFMAACSG
jgi:hypothetical protein